MLRNFEFKINRVDKIEVYIHKGLGLLFVSNETFSKWILLHLTLEFIMFKTGPLILISFIVKLLIIAFELL